KLMPEAHPMDALRTAVSFLGCEDPEHHNNSRDVNYQKAIRLLAGIPGIIASHYRVRQGLKPIPAREDISFPENFFHMCFDRIPPKEVVNALNISLILYAEHTFNASTFTARVISSSWSDIYSAVCGAIGSLKGPLHGGANEAVMRLFDEIDRPENAADWVHKALKDKKKIMGFGHRVYKNGDSRVPTMKECLKDLSGWKQDWHYIEIYDIVENIMVQEKNIYPNLDFPTGPAYHLMDFETDLFTPIFVMSRITGWSAHIMEQLADNKLIRPLSSYSGPDTRPVVPLKDR
ncbi:MAG: bifunctional 2-methylcitrate synthase/citrate synthase, partial [Spirochaetota bacterium]|nr:bifunctional 2-methylcitrate synthase/citrate synthase [Spirochaetota bacterium]